MNSEEYERRIINKYKLSVAIGVIKSKPDDQSIDQYLAGLRKKIEDDEICDLEYTICSDDFALDDDAEDLVLMDLTNENTSDVVNINQPLGEIENIDTNFNISMFDNHNMCTESINKPTESNAAIPNSTITIDNTSAITKFDNDGKITKDYNAKTEKVPNKTNVIDHNKIENKINVCNREQKTNNNTKVNIKKNDGKERVKRKKQITSKILDHQKNLESECAKPEQSDSYIDNDGRKNKRKETVEHNSANSLTNIVDEDSNASITILNGYDAVFVNENNDLCGRKEFDAFEVLKEVARVDEEKENIPSQIFNPIEDSLTQLSYNDSQMTVAHNPVKTVNKTAVQNVIRNVNKEIEVNKMCSPNTTIKNILNNNTITANVDTDIQKNNEQVKLNTLQNDTYDKFVDLDNTNAQIQQTITVFDTYDSQSTQFYTVPEFPTENTHISQSQVQLVMPKKYIYNNINVTEVEISNEKGIELLEKSIINATQEVHDIFDEERDGNNKHETAKTCDFDTCAAENNDCFLPLDDINHTNNNMEENAMDIDVNDDDTQLETQTELIPFKVIEELNRVKSYLRNRCVRERRYSCDSNSNDTGYRSDSQYSQRSLARTSSQPSSCLNQSGHCLLDFILLSSQVPTANEIGNEISQVLGQLIDKLHEDENYPPFLQYYLESVDNLLKEIYTGHELHNTMHKKDELIRKLILLNNSIHIIKYTIQKITTILETVLKHITNKEIVYETLFTVECENLCYIFNIAQIILPKYIKKTKSDTNLRGNENSQTDLTKCLDNSQNSQADCKFPKKSSITDIWRRKWNINYKEEGLFKDSEEKVCVLIKFEEILNKMVVETIDGYSLISYAALQCFNLLQS